VSNPPLFGPCRPEAGPEGCSRPGVSVAMSSEFLSRSRALSSHVRTRYRSLDRSRFLRPVFIAIVAPSRDDTGVLGHVNLRSLALAADAVLTRRARAHCSAIIGAPRFPDLDDNVTNPITVDQSRAQSAVDTRVR
jgi:hypothetical protein